MHSVRHRRDIFPPLPKRSGVVSALFFSTDLFANVRAARSQCISPKPGQQSTGKNGESGRFHTTRLASGGGGGESARMSLKGGNSPSTVAAQTALFFNSERSPKSVGVKLLAVYCRSLRESAKTSCSSGTGAFAELGCRRQLEEGGGLGALGSDSQKPRPAQDPSNSRGGPQLCGNSGGPVSSEEAQELHAFGNQTSAARVRAQGTFGVACAGLRTTQRYPAGRLRTGKAPHAM